MRVLCDDATRGHREEHCCAISSQLLVKKRANILKFNKRFLPMGKRGTRHNVGRVASWRLKDKGSGSFRQHPQKCSNEGCNDTCTFSAERVIPQVLVPNSTEYLKPLHIEELKASLSLVLHRCSFILPSTFWFFFSIMWGDCHQFH